MNFFQKFRDFVSYPTHKRTMGIVIMFVLVSAISLTVIVAQQQQNMKQKAAFEGPSDGPYLCEGLGGTCVSNDSCSDGYYNLSNLEKDSAMCPTNAPTCCVSNSTIASSVSGDGARSRFSAYITTTAERYGQMAMSELQGYEKDDVCDVPAFKEADCSGTPADPEGSATGAECCIKKGYSFCQSEAINRTETRKGQQFYCWKLNQPAPGAGDTTTPPDSAAPTVPALSVNPASIRTGDNLNFSFTGFNPSEEIIVRVGDGNPVPIIADENGNRNDGFICCLTEPAGGWKLTATGSKSNKVAEAIFTINPAEPASDTGITTSTQHSIFAKVFIDNNGNGRSDNGEYAPPGTMVILTGPNKYQDNRTIAETNKTTVGFIQKTDGDYTLQVLVPYGYRLGGARADTPRTFQYSPIPFRDSDGSTWLFLVHPLSTQTLIPIQPSSTFYDCSWEENDGHPCKAGTQIGVCGSDSESGRCIITATQAPVPGDTIVKLPAEDAFAKLFTNKRGELTSRKNQPLTIYLYSSADDPGVSDLTGVKALYKTTIEIAFSSANLSFTFDKAVIPGEYKILLKSPKYLRVSEGVITVPSGGGTIDLALSKNLADGAGDVNNDNILNIADYNEIVINCLGPKKDTSDCTHKDGADINDDGVVNQLDYNIWFKNLSLTAREGD